MSSKIYAVLLAALACSVQTAGQENLDKAHQLNAFIEATMKRLETVPGVSMAVVRGDEVVYLQGQGLADLEKGLPMGPDSEFYIASCTKSFTGLLAVLMDESGILSLDATLAEVLPEVAFDPAIEADKISMRDLLNHTAGLDHMSISYRLAYTGQHDHETLMELMPYLEADENGRGVYEYTNLGYNIYTILLEEKTGRSWQDWLEQEIFEPMGMQHTTAYISRAHERDWPLALPYAGLNEIEQVYLLKKDNTMQSAGGLITTASDAARWVRMQLQNGRLEGRQVFPASVIRKTRELSVEGDEDRGAFDMDSYGLGLSMGDFDGRRVMWHSGGFPGYMSTISFMPEAQMGVVVFVNDAITGFRLMHLLMDYAYDLWLQPEGWEERYAKEQDELVKWTAQIKKRILKDREKRSEREWQLSRDFEAYTGTFSNDRLGTLQIELTDERALRVQMGNLHCVATPYTKPETIRVEMIPGRGEVIQFVEEDGRITGIRSSGITFEKVKS